MMDQFTEDLAEIWVKLGLKLNPTAQGNRESKIFIFVCESTFGTNVEKYKQYMLRRRQSCALNKNLIMLK